MQKEKRKSLAERLQQYVVSYPFNNIAVVLSYLEHLLASENSENAFESWKPRSIELISTYGGTNCVGATEIVKQQLINAGIDSKTVVFKYNFTQFGLSEDQVPYSHCALIVDDPETGYGYLVDPGLGLTLPVPANGEMTTIADRQYVASATAESNQLVIKKPDGSEIVFEFTTPPEGSSTDDLVQKPLLRGTTAFKIDKFDSDGYKFSSIKIDVFKRNISYVVNGVTYACTLDKMDDEIESNSFKALAEQIGYPVDLLSSMLRTIKDNSGDIVSLWFEQIQREYYLHHPEMVSPFETSWADLEKKGYKGGGVAIFLVNDEGELLMYEVPKEREKPRIDRYEGQLNVFIETADPIDPMDLTHSVSGLEPFKENLVRGLSEELGLQFDELPPLIYREIDYRPNIRARIAIVAISKNILEAAESHRLRRMKTTGKIEMGKIDWQKISDLPSKWIEPNAARMISALSKEKLLQAQG